MDLQSAPTLTALKSEFTRFEMHDPPYASCDYSVEDRPQGVNATKSSDAVETKGIPRSMQKAGGSAAIGKHYNQQPGCAPSGKKDWRFCHHAGCTKYRQCSQQNVFKYCATHMPLYGLKLKLFAPKLCKVDDCTKVVTKGPDGTRVYCKLHQEELVLGLPRPAATPSQTVVPVRPARKRRAPSALAENILDNLSEEEEDAEAGSPSGSPLAGGSIRRAARSFPGMKRRRLSSTSSDQEWGLRDEQSEDNERPKGAVGADGAPPPAKRRLPAHLADIFINGDEAELEATGINAGGSKSLVRAPPGMGHPNNSQRCRHPGCCKYAQYSVQKVRLYCSQHMRAHGLEPMNWEKQAGAQPAGLPAPHVPVLDDKSLELEAKRRGSKRKPRPSFSLPNSPLGARPPLPALDSLVHPTADQAAAEHLQPGGRARLRSPRSSASTATQLLDSTTYTVRSSQPTPINTPNSWRGGDPAAAAQQLSRRAAHWRAAGSTHGERDLACTASGNPPQPDTGDGDEFEQGREDKEDPPAGWSLRSASGRGTVSNHSSNPSLRRKVRGGAGTAPKHCQAGGCTKQVQTCVDGSRLYCWVHMREQGLTPMYLNYNPGMSTARKRGRSANKSAAGSALGDASGAAQQGSAWATVNHSSPAAADWAAGASPPALDNVRWCLQLPATPAAMKAEEDNNHLDEERDWSPDDEQDQGSASETRAEAVAAEANLALSRRTAAACSSRAASQVRGEPEAVATTRAVKHVPALMPGAAAGGAASQKLHVREADKQEMRGRQQGAAGAREGPWEPELASDHVDLEAAAILEQMAGGGGAMAQPKDGVLEHNAMPEDNAQDNTVAEDNAVVHDDAVPEDQQAAVKLSGLGITAADQNENYKAEEDEVYKEEEDKERSGSMDHEEHQWHIKEALLQQQLSDRDQEVAELKAQLEQARVSTARGSRQGVGGLQQGQVAVEEEGGGAPVLSAQVKSLASRVSSLEMELERSRTQCRKLEEKLERSWAQSAGLDEELRRSIQEHQQLREELGAAASCNSHTAQKKTACSLAELQAECRLLRGQQRELQRREEAARALLQEQQEQWRRREAALQGQMRAYREENAALQKMMRGEGC